MSRFTRKVESAKEYKETVAHAEALGFEPVEHYAGGQWDAEGEPAWIYDCEIEAVGRKYFKIELDGRVYNCEPSTDWKDDRGYLAITFADRR